MRSKAEPGGGAALVPVVARTDRRDAYLALNSVRAMPSELCEKPGTEGERLLGKSEFGRVVANKHCDPAGTDLRR